MPAERPRVRVKRLVLFGALVLLLALLLEMNRWLPGGWPGGGGARGIRPLSVALGADPSRLEPPTEPSPDWKPEQGVRVEVVGPEGSAVDGWRVGVGARGSADGPARGGSSVLLQARELAQEGVRVSYPTGQVRHVPPEGLPLMPVWRVVLPTPRLEPLRQPGDLVVQVLDAVSGAPLSEASVFGPLRPAPVLTGADGRAVLAGLSERAPLRVTHPGHFDALAVGHAGLSEPLRVRLSPQVALALTLRDPTSGAEAEFTSARIQDAQGDLLWQSEPPGPRNLTSLKALLPGDRLRGARLRVEAPGRPPTDLALPTASGDASLAPLGRRLLFALRGPDGRTLPPRAATVRLGSALGSPPEGESAGLDVRVQPTRDGRLEVLVPQGGEASVVVEADGFAPAVATVSPSDSEGTREVTLSAGIRIPVQVLDVRGRPVREAQVLAVSVVGGVRVQVEALTDAQGRARVGPVPAGPAELYAKAPGKAWDGTSLTAEPAMGTQELRLLPGATLSLVVESPIGAPLAGVHVLIHPADDGPPDRRPPDLAPWRTDARGVLRVDDLPLRAYRLQLALPGHVDETLFDVRPGAVIYFATLVERGP